jgi:hypothetical protein
VDAAFEEIRQRGFVGTYKGANVLVQQQYTDEDGLEYINANELWVLGGTAGKFAIYGGTQVKSWDENTVDYRHYRARETSAAWCTTRADDPDRRLVGYALRLVCFG